MQSELEISHVLFMDVVGYSKLLLNEQRQIRQAPYKQKLAER
jgi:hypothetical protein